MLHPLTFEYQKPTDDQVERMAKLRRAYAELADTIIKNVPEGPDRTTVLRHLRTCAMWTNVAVTRHADGSPRE